MEEELNENGLDDRLISVLHYAEDTQANLNLNQKDAFQIIENTPRSTVRQYWQATDDPSVYRKVNIPKEPNVENTPRSRFRRYWHTAEEHYQKVNTPKVPVVETTPRSTDHPYMLTSDEPSVTAKTNSGNKVEKGDVVPSNQSPKLPSMFQSPVSQDLKKTIEIVESHEVTQVVALESSDEDDVIEVALPQKPIITIESSDEEEECAITEFERKDLIKDTTPPCKKSQADDREVTASPVPSVVSSVSDEFIRGDCITLNISSRHPNNQSFDFSLHEPDLNVQTPSKKKKRKKNKEAITSTPIASAAAAAISNESTVTNEEECFATPKSKDKNKKQKNKSYLVSAKSLPNPDVYDSDSNQSVSELNKHVLNTEDSKSADVSQIDTNASNIPIPKKAMKSGNIDPLDENISNIAHEDVYLKTPKRKDSSIVEPKNFIDLTSSPEHDTSLISIHKNIVMGNVTGFSEPNLTHIGSENAPKFGSTKVPDILYADLDFNNLNGKNLTSNKRRYSLTTLRAEMEKFYNESWGGENFNHREIQKYMSRDKNLWVIDPKDRISTFTKRKISCNYCHRPGHFDNSCRMKPPVCYMCGSTGHKEPRCPRKICVNCGSPGFVYSTMCRNCCHWNGITCAECGQRGHPSSHCPDLWRRYHNTISENTPLEENHQQKKNCQMFCSGCTRRGHLIHTCRSTLPFSGLRIHSPYVTFYKPVYPPTASNQSIHPTGQPTSPQYKNPSIQRNDTITSGSTPHRADSNKRQSKSPVAHESHVNKKRNLSGTEITGVHLNTKNPVNSGQKSKTSQIKDVLEDAASSTKDPIRSDQKPVSATEKAPDYIPICTENHDKQGQIIQHNEVSDTSDVVTSARIYVTGDILDKLNSPEGQEWLNATIEQHNVSVEKTDISFLIIKGTVGDQEAFQTEMRAWIKNKYSGKFPKFDNNQNSNLRNYHSLSNDIPKNRKAVLRMIKKALESLKFEIGDPETLLKELNYSQNRHSHLLKQKAISSKQLSNNRNYINSIFKKLNIIFLGQAGLADGPEHLNKLCCLQQKIINCRQKILSSEILQEIGHHFHTIFSATPREDYADLLSEYYIFKNTRLFSNTKSDTLKLNPKPKLNMNQMVQTENASMMMSGNNIVNLKTSQQRGTPNVAMTVKKLAYYHSRLLRLSIKDATQHKMRMSLVSRLHITISNLRSNPNATARTLKKTGKIQGLAKRLLLSVCGSTVKTLGPANTEPTIND